jgi:hypothetical protein
MENPLNLETVIPHEVEPEVAGPTPRKARLPWSTELLLLLSFALTLLLLVGGARAVFEAGRLAWAAAAGRHVQARLVEIDTVLGPDKTPVQTGAHYMYIDPYNGKTVTRYTPVDNAVDTEESSSQGLGITTKRVPARLLHVGDPLSLRIIGGPDHQKIYFWTESPWGKGVFVALCGIAVMAVGVRLLLILTRWRSARTRLLRDGQAVVGTIIDKPTDFNDTPRYYLRYGYATTDALEPREHEEQVNHEQWKRFEVGQPVTVLYDPQTAERAGLFALMR